MSKEQDKQVKPYRKMSKAELIDDIELKVSKILGLQHQIEELKGKNNIPLKMEFKFATNNYSKEYFKSIIETTKLLFTTRQFEVFTDYYLETKFEYRQFKNGNYVILYCKDIIKKITYQPLNKCGSTDDNNLLDVNNNKTFCKRENLIKELRFYDNLDLVNEKKE